MKLGDWRPGRPLLHVCCISLESPDFDNPPIPPTPPMTKRPLFIEYIVIQDYIEIIEIIKDTKTRDFDFWEGYGRDENGLTNVHSL